MIDAYVPQSYMPVSFVPIDTAEYGKVNNKDLIFEIDYRAFLDDWQNTRREIFLPTKAV